MSYIGETQVAQLLLIEKNAKYCSSLQRELDNAGHETITALSREEALKKLALARDYEVVILDMEILIITSIEDIEAAVKALRRGAYMYFVKPVDIGDLLHGVDSALKNLEKSMAFREYARPSSI